MASAPSPSTLWLSPEPTEFPPAWASAYGEDGYGRYAEFRVGNVVQRLRWIPPGRFLMGSPEDEPERLNKEGPQHPVVITEGFWLFDTPCTQALWEAVMHSNPSHFKSPDRPVEQVSWDETQEFAQRLNTLISGLAFTLPTEAQWEYACRSGTDTALYSGPIEILGFNDAPALDPIAWYGGNSGVDFELENGEDSSTWPDKQYAETPSGTHPVGRKLPTAWGLYDMLGNIWEWCADGLRAYGKTLVIDPVGSREAGSARVIRGGSWDLEAGFCRSAYRGRREPSYRGAILGFRLLSTGSLPSYPPIGVVAEPPPVEASINATTEDLTASIIVAVSPPEFIEGLRDPFPDGTEGPAMVWLRGGEFLMGQDDSPYAGEKPAHPVRVDAFSIGQYPVTFAEYDRFCRETRRKMPEDAGWGRGRRPVIHVSWDDAMDYCDWLSGQTGETYRLASEAEWEFACRAGSNTHWYYGDDEARLGEYAWYRRNSSWQTHPVGEKQANAWRIHDLHGNVLEWCADWYAWGYYRQLANERQQIASIGEQAASNAGDATSAAGNTASGTGASATGGELAANSALSHASENPSGPASGSLLVVRGGSWDDGADLCRSAYRFWFELFDRGDDLGFRLARTGPWRSHPLTLRGAAAPAESEVAREAQPPRRQRFEPYRVFRDRLADFGGAEGPAMVYLPSGEFLMGDDHGQDDEKPVHRVRLDAYALGRTPVTVEEYLRFCRATDGHWPEWLAPDSDYHLLTGRDDRYRKLGFNVIGTLDDSLRLSGAHTLSGFAPDSLSLPVVGISWDDANAYCTWLSEQTGELYELPSEAQWEYACRAGSQTHWCFGDDEARLGEYAWYRANAGDQLHPVAGKRANAWGLYDMHGSVREWCSDWYAEDYYSRVVIDGYTEDNCRTPSEMSATQPFGSAPSSGVPERFGISENPTGPVTGTRRVLRGGSWDVDAKICRSGFRLSQEPETRFVHIGFRLSRRV